MTETTPSLRSLFALAEDRQRKLEAGLGGGGQTGQQQQQLRLAIDEYEACRQAVEELALFSPNETVDDISSENLRYLSIDYRLGELIVKLDARDRRTTLRRARETYERFLGLLDRYGLLSKEDRELHERYLEGPSSFSTASVTDMAARRQTKIARYKEGKRLREKLEFLGRRADGDDADDAELRQLNLERARFAVHRTFASLESIVQEEDVLASAPPEPVLEQRRAAEADGRLRDGEAGPDRSSEMLDRPTPRPLGGGRGGPLLSRDGRPLQPFTLLGGREGVRQGVFRPGHKLPTMTIDEYLEEEKRRGGIVEGGGAGSGRAMEPDEDDMGRADAETMKAREWDEFKDANPR